ncbi:MAG TPA: hypothetical protein VMW22_02110 [Candidatus Desulfaltia sp.]|nr:hypothetical protein [Candidatus Desulfaltia sp.]
MKDEFAEYLRGRKLGEDDVRAAVEFVREFERHLGRPYEEAGVEDVKDYVSKLISMGENSGARLLALARYSHYADMRDVWIYWAAVLGGRTIFPSIRERLQALAGEGALDRVFGGLDTPPLGSPPEEYPEATAELMRRLEAELRPELYRRVLAGNHHRVPVERFLENRGRYVEAESTEAYLKEDHDRAVAELEEYAGSGRVWYEQVITPEVVEYVRGNQEMLSAVLRGGKLYITKIPYAPREYLAEEDPTMRRFYMCHCPLARSAILAGGPEIPLDWCYCSAGFEKLPYDVLFGEDLEVEVLESAISGSDRCRFAVTVPAGKLK